MQKKGQISHLMPHVTALVALGIKLVVGFLILSEVAANTTVAADGYATNSTTEVQRAMNDIPGWLPIIVITVIGALLLALVAYFRTR